MWYWALEDEDNADPLLRSIEESESLGVHYLELLWAHHYQDTHREKGQRLNPEDEARGLIHRDSLRPQVSATIHPVKVARYFGTVPPRRSLELDKVNQYADRLANSLSQLEGLDAILVYDIQEEESRWEGGTQRPFAFSPTHEPRLFAKLLHERTRVDPILYHTVAYQPKEEFEQWLEETTGDSYQIRSIVFVGGSKSAIVYPGYSVLEATRFATERYPELSVGGIVLPERHRDRGTEHILLKAKTEAGIAFFTSQVVYNADLVIWLLRDYDELCKTARCTPARLVFVFAPFGRKDTANFLKWLGVEIPVGTEKRVLSRQTTKDCVKEAVDICRENFRRILNAIEYYSLSVPVGFAVESVSKYQDEFAGSIELYHLLSSEAVAFEKNVAAQHQHQYSTTL